jgi:CelD/BcsL family acetyltransferase involved in cellulose biosynthesis
MENHKPKKIKEAAETFSVEVFRHPDELPPDVRHLFEVGEKESVESSAAWYRNLVNSIYADKDVVRIFVLRKLGRPVAALPLIASKSAGGQHVASLSNYYTAIYSPLIEKGLKVRELVPLLGAVKNACTPLASLRFAPMDPASAGYRLLLRAMPAAGFAPFRFFSFGNWYLQVKDDWPTYLKNREGTVRSTIKRMTKKFSAEGGTLELVLGGADLAKGLAAYEHVYGLSWKQAEPHPAFIPGLVQTCAERGWLRLGVAWLKDKPIAAQLWIVANGKANIYKLAYDEGHKSYAPGTLLTAMLMEHAIEKDHVTEVDYLIGDDPYKKAWMSHRRERWGIVAYNPRTLTGLIEMAREVLGRSLKPWLKRLKKPALKN